MRHIDVSVPSDLDVYLVIDNYATHKHAKVNAWLARRPLFHLHFALAYASWLNLEECGAGIIAQQAIRCGTFSSVKDLVAKINLFVDNFNHKSQLFVWTETADLILAKVERISRPNSGMQHKETSNQ